MKDDTERGSTVSAEDAFALLGNDIRMGILRALGDTGEPMGFAEVRESIGIRHGGQFNYHLDKLVGHFVAKTDEGYELRQAGRRVYQTVLSGVMTDNPVVEPVPTDNPCPFCGAPSELSYEKERVERYCAECEGFYEESTRPASTKALADPAEYGYLGSLGLPPAGVHGRSAQEILEAAFTWGILEFVSIANGICPRCSASVTHSLEACESHDDTAGVCRKCGMRQAVQFESCCSNCRFSLGSSLVMYLLADPDLLAFVTAHGYNPFAEEGVWAWEYHEEIISTAPFEGRFTFTIDDDSLALTIDEDLSVIDASKF